MPVYNLSQWLTFFYIYCLVGWVWESCYVSAKKRKWVNRGFMHGPLLPIYGSGAITVLAITIGVKDNLYLVFLLGMIGATILELITGYVMEMLFKVRYWDYSNQKINFHGYICLTSSLAWGVFSVIFMRFVQQPVANIVLSIKRDYLDIIVVIITVAFVIDLTQSFNEAMDLRAILTKLSANPEIKKLQKRVDVLIAVAEDELKQVSNNNTIKKLSRRKSLEQNIYALKNKFNLKETSDKQYLRSAKIILRNPGAASKIHKDALNTVKNLTRRVKKIEQKNKKEQKGLNKN